MFPRVFNRRDDLPLPREDEAIGGGATTVADGPVTRATLSERLVARLAGGASRGTVVAGYAEGSAASRLTAEVNVAMVYLGMLGRAPDSGGWAYWVPIARTRSVDALVVGFQHSTEYVNRVT